MVTSSQPSWPKLLRICPATWLRIGATWYSHLVMARTLLRGCVGRVRRMTDSTPDALLLARYVDAWSVATAAFADLAASLSGEDWARPTDLPGWDVKAVVSHVAHLEGVLAGAEHEHAEV